MASALPPVPGRTPYGRSHLVSRPVTGAGGSLVVGARTRISASLIAVEFHDPDGRPLPRWSAGSHVNLVLASGLVRPYSLCGRTDDRRTWRILVRRRTSSRGGSAHVHDRLRTGDEVRHLGVVPGLVLARAERYRFLAGGAGVAPLIPLARLAASVRAPWSMTVFGRDAPAVAGWGELDDLRPAITTAPDGRHALNRTVEGLEPGSSVYACGPGPFVDAIERAMADRPGLTLFRERFDPPEHGSSRPMEIVLARSKLSFSVPAGTSLNEGLRMMGVQVPVACGAGFCGACAVGVVEGVPDHRDRLLTADRRARGDMILTCVSRSRTPRLVLDL